MVQNNAECFAVKEKCCREVLKRGVGEECRREVSEESVGEESCREVL